MLRRLVKAGSWVFLGILLGRLAGLVREVAIAAHFGATPRADLAVLLLTSPEIMRNLLVGGAMEAALIPEFKRLDPVRARALYHQFMLFSGAIFGVVALVVAYKASWVTSAFAPGLDPSQREAALRLIRISMWSLPLTVITATSTAFLQSHHRFAVPAMGTLIFNCVLILDLVLPIHVDTLLFLAWAVVLGALLRWLSQFLRVEVMDHPPAGPERPGWQITKPLLVRYVQVFTAGGMLFLLPVLARRLASFEGNGVMALFNYSQKMVELPSGVCLTIFAVALLPTLSELLHDEARMEQGISLIRHALLVVFAVSLALALPLAWFSGQLTRTAFGWGSMGPQALGIIGMLTVFGMISLPAQGLCSITLAAFNAKRDNKPAFWVSFGSVLLYVPLAMGLRKLMGLAGLMLALALVNWLMFLAHLVILRNRHGMKLVDGAWMLSCLRMAAAAGLAFLPFALVSGRVQGTRPALALAAASTVCCALAGILSERTYREKALSWTRRLLPGGSAA
jgi:murein biosynthesis integral membrane protein MurJ